MQGEIFHIQKFCVNDGPGIRTTVFLKGCPLRCVWCHNPEGQSRQKQILFYPERCTQCGKCENLTVSQSSFFCPNEAKEICGQTVSSDEIVAEVMKDFEFYENSGGGITLSGGEPLFQFAFAVDILQKCKDNKLHTAIETCGFADKEKMLHIAAYTDLFLFDFKESNPQLHEVYTGVSNILILENLSLLNERKKDIILRCPIIPGYNDRQEHYQEICRLANTLKSIVQIELAPYHTLGESKYTALEKPQPTISTQTAAQLNAIIRYISKKTNVPVKRV